MKMKVGFICVHNSCRSQIAEALMKKYAGEYVDVYSAGTNISREINSDAVRLMKNRYEIDISKTQYPKTIDDIPTLDYLITMGCNVVCPIKKFNIEKLDWGLDDPTGKTDDIFISIIEEIEEKVLELINKIKIQKM